MGSVLIVDDSEDFAEVLGWLLEGAGYEVHTAQDGGAALVVGAEFRPATVLLDLVMPNGDGYEIARRIRATDWGADARLIAITGYTQREVRERVANAGFDGYLAKPFEMDALLATLQAPGQREADAAGSSRP